ncbi:MAG: hypothetical protein JOY60_17820 [Burkholderiaceae bacterium]|nr:hypothetical protein [Burkholderiaceae bacterium]
MKVVDWGVGFVKAKAQTPKYAATPQEKLLARLSVNLQRDFKIPSVYRAWILEQIAGRLSSS